MAQHGRPQRTPEKDTVFFDEFARSANVSAACSLAGYARRSVYEWKAADPSFAQLWKEAENEATSNLEAEAYRRAVFGVHRSEPIMHLGHIVATREIDEYSDTLAIFLLKARNPDKYRERIEMTVNWRQEARTLGVNPDDMLQIMIDQARQQLEANADIIDVTPGLELETGDQHAARTTTEREIDGS